jgi:hypothetical protein
VICDRCGATGWLKTCRWRDGGEQTFVLCDGCHGPLAGAVWIIPGPLTVTAQCSGCGLYRNPSEMAELRGLARERHVGVCPGCA